MEELLNEATGEVYSVTKEDIKELKDAKNELAIKHHELVAKVLSDEVYSMYEQYERFKSEKEIFECKLRKLFEENGIKKFENEYFSISYIPAHLSKRVDTDLLKKSGLYDEFTKESEVKESIRVRFK